MFTGLVEAVGETRDVREIPQGLRFAVVTRLASELGLGDSVAVNGVCLTVAEKDDASFTAEVSPETVRVTTLSTLRAGQTVNLERPIPADGRLGGHFVLGHVDGVGTISAIEKQAEFSLVTVAYPASVAPYVVPKGSIAIDGISLTVAALQETALEEVAGNDAIKGRVQLQIVPYTWLHTNLRDAGVGDLVNLECDIIGKYVVRAVRETT